MRLNSLKEPHTPTYFELGRGRHSGKWLFDIEGWKRLFSRGEDVYDHPQ